MTVKGTGESVESNSWPRISPMMSRNKIWFFMIDLALDTKLVEIASDDSDL